MTSPTEAFAIDTSVVRRAANRAARGYDEAAALQGEVRKRLLERLDYVRLSPQVVLDLGAATGDGSAALQTRYPDAAVIALDIAENMLLSARGKHTDQQNIGYLCADAVALPLANDSVDLVFSNLLLPACHAPERVLREVGRVLRPGGLFNFASAGPDTLYELRDAWAQVDDGPHVHLFSDMHNVGDAVLAAGLAEPVLDLEYFTLCYRSLKGIMRDLKACGASNAMIGRARGLLGTGRWQALEQVYEKFRDQEQRLPVSCEIIYGQAWGRAPGSGVVLTDGEARVPLSAIGRRSSSTLE